MNLDYSRVTHEQLLEQFRNRIISDPRFKDMSAAAIYQMYMEMMAGTFDMIHFYLGRTAEEMFLDSAKLDSSVIKLSKNLGYNPKRAIPATANIAIKLKGPLPKQTQAGDVIWFNNEQLSLKFNNKPYRLDYCYSYEFTEDDVINGVNNPSWSKVIEYSNPHELNKKWIPITSNSGHLSKIKIVQCEIKTAEIYAISNAEHLTESYQFYDIDDVKFCNYYGIRDPYAMYNNEYTPMNGWCKVGIGLNKNDAFSEEKICDIEIENIYCNPKVKKANDDVNLTKKLNVCRIESNQDKTVRISFGDGSLVNNGFNSENEILYVQYVVTDGYAANTPDVVGCQLSNSSRIMAHAEGRLYDVTDNIVFTLTTNIANGDDFESALRMKNSAAVYFASRGQLVNTKDFNDYFNSMSRPIHAKNGVAWTTPKLLALKDENNPSWYNTFKTSVDNTKNAVFYTVIGDLYQSLGNNEYKVKMLYTDGEDNTLVGSTTLYTETDTMLDHLSDLASCCKNGIEAIAKTQRTDEGDPFYLNTSTIYKDIEEKLQFGVVPICIPPIVQYFDLVGTVQLDRTANISLYKRDIESKIYKWLSDRQKFNNKIYKSDIVKLIYDNAATRSVNVDITPSNLTRDTSDYYCFAGLETEVTDDITKPYITGKQNYTNNYIVIPAMATKSIINSNVSEQVALSVAKFEAAFSVGIGINSNVNTHAEVKRVPIKTATQLENGRIALELENTKYDFGTGNVLWISFNVTEDPYHTDTVNSDDIITALNNATEYDGTTNTPVALPYRTFAKKDSTKKNSHELTYMRKNNQFDLFTLTEKSFNLVIMPNGTNIANYQNDYPAVKYIIEDNILDDNNNIVNYTLPNEISVVRLRLNYTYGR